MDLTGYDRETLARWWCELNVFRWPADFPEPEPPGYHAMSDREKYDDPRCRAAWDAVDAAVPLAEALAYWNGPFMQGRQVAVDAGLLPPAAHQDNPGATSS